MEKLFIIRHPTFDTLTLVAIGVSDEAILRWIRRNTDIVLDQEAIDNICCPGLGRTVQHGAFSMIRVKSWKGTPADIGILTHEAFHLAEFIFRRIGVGYDLEISGEVWAYFIQSTVEQILLKLKPTRKKRKT